MIKRTGVFGCARHGKGVWALCVASIMASLLVALFVSGCTSEADLVETLSTTEDVAVREKAAADLAKRISPEATELLAAAADDSEIAADGLDALAEAYGAQVGETVDKIAESEEKELSEKDELRLEETLALLGSIANGAAVDELIKIGTKVCTDSYLKTIRNAAADELEGIGVPAVEPLMALAEDDAWACGALRSLGGDAVPALVGALAEQKWCEQVLADIGKPAIEEAEALLSSEDPIEAHRALGVLLRMFDDMDPAVDETLLTEGMAWALLADLCNSEFEEENAQALADGFDHQLAAEVALVSTGGPAAGPILSSGYEDKWYLLEWMGEEAVPLLTETMKGKDRENAVYAAMCMAYMAESSPSAVSWFTSALDSSDLKIIADYYMFYIALGQEGSESVIRSALLEHGGKQMALDCLNSGNDELDAAGRKWASQHNYRVYTKSGEDTGFRVPWGV